MELRELEKLKECSTEDDLIKIAQEIDDKVTFRGYNSEQILNLINEIVKIDLLSVKYETREEILYLLCDMVSYHDVSCNVNWENIISVQDKLEDDLREYIKELMESVR